MNEKEKVNEILCQQLDLLAEKSKKADERSLVDISRAMVDIGRTILRADHTYQ